MANNRYYESPRWMFKYQNCAFPVVLDTYSKCSYGCLYCLSQFQRSNKRFDGKSQYERPLLSFNVDRIIDLFNGECDINGTAGWISARRAIQWGGLSDPFDENERRLGKSLKLLHFLSEIQYPISISTKAAWFCTDDRYVRVLKNYGKNLHIKFSIITTDEAQAKKIERGVPAPKERFDAMSIASSLGVHTTLRLRPFIIGLSDVCIKDLISNARASGAKSLSTEFLCIDRRSGASVREAFRELSSVLGYDIVAFYKKNSRSDTYMRLNESIKHPIFSKIAALCNYYGIAFYNSDLDCRELTRTCCCCGAPDCFSYSRGTLVNALKLAQYNGKVRFSDIYGQELKLMDGVRYRDVINTGTALHKRKLYNFSLAGYVRYLWNTPEETHSPKNEFRDALLPDGVDENGDIIYAFNRRALG